MPRNENALSALLFANIPAATQKRHLASHASAQQPAIARTRPFVEMNIVADLEKAQAVMKKLREQNDAEFPKIVEKVKNMKYAGIPEEDLKKFKPDPLHTFDLKEEQEAVKTELKDMIAKQVPDFRGVTGATRGLTGEQRLALLTDEQREKIMDSLKGDSTALESLVKVAGPLVTGADKKELDSLVTKFDDKDLLAFLEDVKDPPSTAQLPTDRAEFEEEFFWVAPVIIFLAILLLLGPAPFGGDPFGLF
jgi:hypothetical protein